MAVAEERRERCDGCGRAVTLEDLTTVTMPDGETLACCTNCEPHARQAAEKLSSLETRRDACDGCAAEFPRSELEDVVLADGTVITCCPDCIAEAPGRGEDADDESPETTDIATPRDLCSQCHEWHEVELYRVTTVDGRTEELCPDCKALAEEKGIVNEVKMREAEARDVLDVDEGASEREIRQAFLERTKHAHPDRDQGSRSAFILVKEAYDRLT